MEWGPFLFEQFATPGKLLGHLAYVLLVASMMMRSMKWLRIVAVSSGVVSALYGHFFLRDFVTVFWEIIFVSVNLLQLLLLEFENRRARFSEDEQVFISAAVPHVERAHARRLLKLAEHLDLEAGALLTEEGKPVEHLYFIIRGTVRIDKDEAIVGVCGHDDFIGEIGYMTKTNATATAVVTNSARCLKFKHTELRALLAKEDDLRHALESSFNRNLVGKLVKSNASAGTARSPT